MAIEINDQMEEQLAEKKLSQKRAQNDIDEAELEIIDTLANGDERFNFNNTMDSKGKVYYDQQRL